MKKIKSEVALGSEQRFKFGVGVLEDMLHNFKNVL